jgi:hypothetical protein
MESQVEIVSWIFQLFYLGMIFKSYWFEDQERNNSQNDTYLENEYHNETNTMNLLMPSIKIL